MSLVALSIDAMLPALSLIKTDLNVENENSIQLIVSFLFIGYSVGQLFYGPISDSIGRKPALYLGFAIYFLGSFFSVFAESLTIMLIGRILQGFGVASPRIISVAIVRDRFSGREMAKVMSFIMVIFIISPMIAPAMGQAVLFIADWRAIFTMFIIFGSILLTWFFFRQPETLLREKRSKFTFKNVWNSLVEIFTNRVSIGYTVVAGFISSAFLGYLSLVQPILQVKYELGELFPLYFAMLALAIGLANYLNGKLVVKYGMVFLTRIALVNLILISFVFIGVAIVTNGSPELWLFLIYMSTTLFCVGIIWGNLNAMAMEPLGHIAGIGAAVVGFVATFISIPFGILIGQMYTGSVLPMILGFAVFGTLSLLLLLWVTKKG